MGFDHLLGRPSLWWKRFEVIIIVYSTIKYLEFNRHRTPKPFKDINRALHGFKPWQIVTMTLLARYFCSRLFLLLFLSPPELYSKLYSRNFYRATWILTALDAGFWTAANIRPPVLRHVSSIVLTIWYLFHADDADTCVRKIRSDCSVEMMRISWEKSTSPLLWLLAAPVRPFVGYIREFWIPRAAPSDLSQYPSWRTHTRVKLFYSGTKRQLASVQKLVLHFPGGGFVTMSPENHEDYVRRWTRALGTEVAVASVDYCKAPEFPFPYAIEECFELYCKLCETNGSILGVNTARKGNGALKISLAGDSAGANITASVTIKVIEKLQKDVGAASPRVPLQLRLTTDSPGSSTAGVGKLRKPEGLLLIYGALNFNMASWIAPDDRHAKLLRPDSNTSLSGLMKNYKGTKYHESRLHRRSSVSEHSVNIDGFSGISTPYLSLTSRMAFFNDRIIPPELARAMSLLYLGNQSSVNPATDYLLSPMIAPDDILMEFPRVWMMCGECDPFVDDTVIFAARIRAAISRKMELNGGTDEETVATDTSDSRRPSMTDIPRELAKASPSSDSSLPGWGGWATSFTRRLLGPYNEDQSSASVNSPTSPDDGHDSDDDYGEISRDPIKHVTVKIYAGLSHAFLQMLAFLPEAHHAATLSGQFLCEMFELSDRISLRKKRRRSRPSVRLEMRDEDNIPDSIDLPLGAEYRVGVREIQVAKHSKPSKKYTIGDFSDNEDGMGISIHDDYESRNEHPLVNAMDSKRRSVMNQTHSEPRSRSKPRSDGHKQANSGAAKSSSAAKGADMFLKESELLHKRMARNVD